MKKTIQINDPDMDLGISVMNSLYNRTAAKVLPNFSWGFATSGTSGSSDDPISMNDPETLENHEPSTSMLVALDGVAAKAKAKAKAGPAGGKPKGGPSTGKRNSNAADNTGPTSPDQKKQRLSQIQDVLATSRADVSDINESDQNFIREQKCLILKCSVKDNRFKDNSDAQFKASTVELSKDLQAAITVIKKESVKSHAALTLRVKSGP